MRLRNLLFGADDESSGDREWHYDRGDVIRSNAKNPSRNTPVEAYDGQQLGIGKALEKADVTERAFVAAVLRPIRVYKRVQTTGSYVGNVVLTGIVPVGATFVQAYDKYRVSELYVTDISGDASTAESPYAGVTYEEGKMHSVVGGVDTDVANRCKTRGIYVYLNRHRAKA